MALKGLDIFKLTPKTNCKDCGSPTCMAFAMKVAQGAVPLEKCPHLSDAAKEKLSEATAPPMRTIQFGAGENEHALGGETVMMRHEKTFVNKCLYAVEISDAMDAGEISDLLSKTKAVDYERIGEHMYVEIISVHHDPAKSASDYVSAVKLAAEAGRCILLDCTDLAAAKAALEVCKDTKPILDGADAGNAEEMNAIAKEAGAVLGVRGASIDEIYDTVVKLEGLGNKNLMLDVTASSLKETFARAVRLRRAAIKGGDRACGYPAIVNTAKLAPGDSVTQSALAALFTARYGSIIVMGGMSYAQALPLYGLRQNLFTDPQKPMKVTPGIYAINGANENSVCAVTVDFALTYFVVSGEIDRSKVPCNLLITDAGGYSVLTAWAAGKLSASSIAKFFQEMDIAGKIKNRTLIIPGKVAVLKGEIEEKLPGWKVVVGPNEAVQLVRFLKDYQ